ncbi:MAG: hotdog domain-containing protein [Angustibacter sp.]
MPTPKPASGPQQGSDPRLGLVVTHRRYVPYSHSHYAGDLVDGAYVLGCFGDVATEVCIRTDGDEGLFASYTEVQFLGPVRAGDVLETTARVVRIGRRSRDVEFEARVLCRARADLDPSRSEVLHPPAMVVTARGTVVVRG